MNRLNGVESAFATGSYITVHITCLVWLPIRKTNQDLDIIHKHTIIVGITLTVTWSHLHKLLRCLSRFSVCGPSTICFRQNPTFLDFPFTFHHFIPGPAQEIKKEAIWWKGTNVLSYMTSIFRSHFIHQRNQFQRDFR